MKYQYQTLKKKKTSSYHRLKKKKKKKILQRIRKLNIQKMLIQEPQEHGFKSYYENRY